MSRLLRACASLVATLALAGAVVPTGAEPLIDAPVGRVLETLPIEDAITWSQGSGARKLRVFADPDCGWCKHLERQLAAVPDITVHVFLYPILGSEARTRAESIWCAADRGRAWQAWMRERVEPAPARCDDAAIDRNLARGRRLGVIGTPTLWFDDGRTVAGSVDAAELERALAALPR